MRFNNWKTFCDAADRAGLRVKLVTQSKSNDYYQVREADGMIVGFWNSSQSLGSIDFPNNDVTTAPLRRRLNGTPRRF